MLFVLLQNMLITLNIIWEKPKGYALLERFLLTDNSKIWIIIPATLIEIENIELIQVNMV